MLLSLAAIKNFEIRHVDITSAFLHVDLDRPISMEQTHFRENNGNLVCKLHKAIYGLKAAPRKWQLKSRSVFRQHNFKPLKYDPCVFRYNDTIISTYVDDFMILSPTKSQVDNANMSLAAGFQLKDLGDMTKFLGISIDRKPDGIRIYQADKIIALCDDMGMLPCKGAYTPIADDNMIDSVSSPSCVESDTIKYRSAVGMLLHIANMTRPDIQYAVNRLCRHFRNPSENAMLALKHIIPYILRTRSAALLFPIKGKANLTASSDSSWENITSSKGTSGFLFLINDFSVAL